MKIQLLSDLHIEFGEHRYCPTDADVVVLAGDIHVGAQGVAWAAANIKDKPVIYVMGNHEYYRHAYPTLGQTLKEMAGGTNVHVLENDHLCLDGVNFFGATLWTDFNLFGDLREASDYCEQRMNDFRRIQFTASEQSTTPLMNAKLTITDIVAIHTQSLQWLAEQLERYQGEKNVVVTHHGPSRRSLPSARADELTSAGYVSDLEWFITRHQPLAWLHGHLHNNNDYRINQCRVLSNPRGYSHNHNLQFDDALCLEV